jgi:hypothetical protein
MGANGWAEWGDPRPPREQLRLRGSDQARYCPRCDKRTAWTLGGNDLHPDLLACECGMTVATELSLDELDNTQRHYRLTTTNVDDMVGLPIGARQ